MSRPRRLSDVVTTDNVEPIAASLRKYGYDGPDRHAEVARWLEVQGEDINTPVAGARPTEPEQRPRQEAFRRVLLRAYEGRCAITGCDVEPALETAHVADWWSENRAGILLRAEAEDHQVFVPAGVTTDDLCLTPRSSGPASAAFTARKQAAAAADVILTNHALALTDCRYRGGILGTGDTVPTVDRGGIWPFEPRVG